MHMIGFSVLDGTIDRAGGVGPMDAEFRARLERAHAHGLIPSGLVVLRHVQRAHQREQWIVESVRPDMHAALTALVVAWQETEDVDATLELTR